MSIFKYGLRQMLPEDVRLVSGPGCPVCVTPAGMIDAFVELAMHPEVTTVTFGDMMRVPGSRGSLAQARADGADVRIVYSPMDALKLAVRNPDRMVVFLAVGFETTAPAIAATVLDAHRRKLRNFCIFPANKLMPPPLRSLMNDPDLQVQGLLCPGHVSVITGSDAFSFLADEYGIACAVAGFEPTDIMLAVGALVDQVQRQRPCIENCYGRAVSAAGNLRAGALVKEVFHVVDSEWRGIGTIEKSGLALRTEYTVFDITQRFSIMIPPSREPAGCRCGRILKGISLPHDCPLFAERCTPASPVGPCMVSNEGTCAAWYRYGALNSEKQ
jgi:hydrogenase expression/formation protein HypD